MQNLGVIETVGPCTIKLNCFEPITILTSNG